MGTVPTFVIAIVLLIIPVKMNPKATLYLRLRFQEWSLAISGSVVPEVCVCVK